MEVPEIRFAKSGDVNIGYQRFGTGPDVVLIPPLVSNIELMWEHELWRRALEVHARHTRVLHFDKRGIGISDRFEQHPTLEQRIDDINAVMDAEGVKRANILGLSEGGLMAQLFAAVHPERVDRLVLLNSVPGASAWSQLHQYTDKPIREISESIGMLMQLVETWGRDPSFLVDWFMPSQRDNPSFLRWIARYERQTGSPADIRRQIESLLLIDASERLQDIKAPTLVMNVAGDRMIPPAAGRYLAARIADADYVELDGEDHFCWCMPGWRKMEDCWIEFVTGTRPVAGGERRFATVLFTDIVRSTERSSAVGDEVWRATLESHDRIAWRMVDGHRGKLVKNTGDGLLVLFERPSDALACAAELRRELAGIGLRIRGGLHTGEVTVREDGDVTGLAVNLAARVERAAREDSIYVSSTVRDTVLGGDFLFDDRGEHHLKGIEGSWRLYELTPCR